jgi:integrase
MRAVGDEQVAEWIKGGRNLGTIDKLRLFFNDAKTAEAGRIITVNPFDNLGLARRRAAAAKRRNKTMPPGQADIIRLIQLGDELAPPSFAGYLDVAVHEAMRPGELDALRWTKVDFQNGTILVDEQWNAKTHTFTPPKHWHIRTIALTDPARERLLRLPRESEFCFTTLRGTHYRPNSRAWHWNRVRAAAGIGNTRLYDATRHYFGWYAWNVLELDERDIALHFGHQDGGELIRTTYGHADEALARDRIRAAYAKRPTVPTPLRRAG